MTRIKLTLGENVLVGEEVEPCDTTYYSIMVDGYPASLSYSRKMGWQREVIAEPIVLPTKLNAVIEFEDEDGTVRPWILTPSAHWNDKIAWCQPWCGGSLSVEGLEEIVADYPDHYRVIFEGEDSR